VINLSLSLNTRYIALSVNPDRVSCSWLVNSDLKGFEFYKRGASNIATHTLLKYFHNVLLLDKISKICAHKLFLCQLLFAMFFISCERFFIQNKFVNISYLSANCVNNSHNITMMQKNISPNLIKLLWIQL
jgi:hypothetical protein